jgi:hypothetical protein
MKEQKKLFPSQGIGPASGSLENGLMHHVLSLIISSSVNQEELGKVLLFKSLKNVYRMILKLLKTIVQQSQKTKSKDGYNMMASNDLPTNSKRIAQVRCH